MSITAGPISSRPIATAPAKPTIARIVIRIARPKASPPSVASSPDRCGSSEACTLWKSCSGARVISSALKTTPASAAVAVALTVSTAALRSACSASWIAATDSAKPAPARSVRRRASAAVGPARARRRGRRSAHGTTSSDASGAARMPSATADCPDAMPSATATGKQKRDTDSNSTRPPYSPNHWCPAR